jgi:hypothetical protein
MYNTRPQADIYSAAKMSDKVTLKVASKGVVPKEEDDSWKETFQLPPNIDKQTKKRLLNREGDTLPRSFFFFGHISCIYVSILCSATRSQRRVQRPSCAKVS